MVYSCILAGPQTGEGSIEITGHAVRAMYLYTGAAMWLRLRVIMDI
jgi:hypothetical protein